MRVAFVPKKPFYFLFLLCWLEPVIFLHANIVKNTTGKQTNKHVWTTLIVTWIFWMRKGWYKLDWIPPPFFNDGNWNRSISLIWCGKTKKYPTRRWTPPTYHLIDVCPWFVRLRRTTLALPAHFLTYLLLLFIFFLKKRKKKKRS